MLQFILNTATFILVRILQNGVQYPTHLHSASVYRIKITSLFSSLGGVALHVLCWDKNTFLLQIFFLDWFIYIFQKRRTVFQKQKFTILPICQSAQLQVNDCKHFQEIGSNSLLCILSNYNLLLKCTFIYKSAKKGTREKVT